MQVMSYMFMFSSRSEAHRSRRFYIFTDIPNFLGNNISYGLASVVSQICQCVFVDIKLKLTEYWVQFV